MAQSNALPVVEEVLQPVADRSEEAGIYAKVTWRLVPFLFLCYVAAYLDRVNVGFAKLQMLNDLHFSETVYGFGAGIFFIGYFLFEVPSNLILHKVGARWWIARIMLTWAVLSAATMFAHTPTQFYVLRFLLGLAEAGLFPGVILYLTYWYPAHRRGKIIAMFMTGIPLSGVIGGPMSGWIMKSLSGANGWAGWQWLYLLEAVPSILLGLAVLGFLDNGIKDAKWLSNREKQVLHNIVAEDKKGVESHQTMDGFTHKRVWVLSGIYFCFIIGLYGLSFWLPTLVKNTGVKDPLTIGLLTAVPYAVAALAMVLVGRNADEKRERRWHVALPGLIGVVGWIFSVLYSHNTAVAILALTIATIGVMTSLSMFWALPVTFLGGAAAATGVAVINSVGNLAGFGIPFAIGWIIDKTHSPDLGVYILAASLALGSLLVLALPKRLVNR